MLLLVLLAEDPIINELKGNPEKENPAKELKENPAKELKENPAKELKENLLKEESQIEREDQEISSYKSYNP